MKLCVTTRDALVVVDVQRDFLPGGALAVKDGNDIIAPMNEYIRHFAAVGQPIYFTRDWHPADHLSFAQNGGVWPTHCVAETNGASFSSELYLPPDNKFIVSKGMAKEFDAYSGFQGTQLEALLRERGIKRIFVGGLATDYCVKNTAVGAMNLGFGVVVLADAMSGVEAQAGDCKRAVAAMLDLGAVAITLEDLKK